MSELCNSKFLKDSPLNVLNEKDFNTFMLKFGAFLFLINNKNINPTFLFLALVKDENMQQLFREMSGVATLPEMLKHILVQYPNLIKSKIVKDNSIKILKKKEQKKKREFEKYLKMANKRTKKIIKKRKKNAPK